MGGGHGPEKRGLCAGWEHRWPSHCTRREGSVHGPTQHRMKCSSVPAKSPIDLSSRHPLPPSTPPTCIPLQPHPTTFQLPKKIPCDLLCHCPDLKCPALRLCLAKSGSLSCLPLLLPDALKRTVNGKSPTVSFVESMLPFSEPHYLPYFSKRET